MFWNSISEFAGEVRGRDLLLMDKDKRIYV